MHPSKTILQVSLIVFVVLGAFLLTRADLALSRAGESHNPSNSTGLQFASTPTPTATSLPPTPAVYLPLAFNQAVELLAAWTDDGQGKKIIAFLPGEPIRYVAKVSNQSSQAKIVRLTWTQTNPCGEDTIFSDEVRLPLGISEQSFTSTVPDCLGIYTATVEIPSSEPTSLSTIFVVNTSSSVVIADQQGFDKCNPPSIANMQTWWDSSPYWSANIYIGGISLACDPYRLDPFWLHTVAEQGWTFIPTWVGPQAPCTTFRYRMSSNASVAYQEGRDEADLAVSAATSLGLLGDAVIYYDVEAYGSNASEACRNTVASFIQGWVERLHELEIKAGAYGAPCTSYITDWSANNPAPDDVWIAHWYTTDYDPDATVWDVPRNIPCITDDFWPNHQRIKQYTGDHTETWGGVSVTIDSNVLDGEVTALLGIPAGASGQLASSILSSPAPQIRAMRLLSPNQGWMLQGERLLWTYTGGSQWQDITPQSTTPTHILGATFLDPRQGWIVRQSAQSVLAGELTLLHTEDGGLTWQTFPIQLPTQDGDPPIVAAYLDFIDAHSGWIAFKLQTGSSFSLGRLFVTRDGGRTWQERSLPLGEPVKFLDGERGWVAGGPPGDLLYRTDDGGQTWQLQSLPLPSSARHVFVGLPAFENEQAGTLAVTLAGSPDPGLAIYETRDGGDTWSLATHFDFDPSYEPEGALPFSLDANGHWWVAPRGSNQLYAESSAGVDVASIASVGLPRGVVALGILDDQLGWALVQEGTCHGQKSSAGQTVSPDGETLQCVSSSRLFMTSDGGRTWSDISPR